MDFLRTSLVDFTEDKDFSYACCVCDVLNWVLGEETTERFLGDAYLNIEKLREWARRLEKITGVSFEDYR